MTPLPRLLRVSRLLFLCLPWTVFTAWLVVYHMPLSALVALGGLWALWPAHKPAWPARLLSILLLLSGLVAVPLIGLPEYATHTQHLHCRTLGFLGKAPYVPVGLSREQVCDASDLAEGARIAIDGGPLFSTHERVGVHGFNLLLALGGTIVGLPEVALETLWMSLAANPLGPQATTVERRRQCQANTGKPGGDALLASPRTWNRDLPMRSEKVRQRIASGVEKLGTAPGSTLELGEIHWSTGGNNGLDGYAAAFEQDSIRVALALEVPDSHLSLLRLPDGGVEATWEGTILYPGLDIGFNLVIPTLWGPQNLRVSETIFCGMQMDGAMNPYLLRYRWRVE